MHKSKKIFSTIGWSILIAVFLINGLLMWKSGQMLLDSDMSSELVLAKLLSEEGKILTTNWYYSTELRILNTQLVFAPLFYLFNDWHMVRTVGSAVLWMLMLVSFWYLCKQANISKYFPVAATMMLLPLSHSYFYIIIIGVYYIPHVTISFLTVGMCLQYCNTSIKSKKILLLILMSLVSAVAGMGGLRQLLVLYIPLMVTSVIVLWFKRNYMSVRLLICSSATFICSVFGYLINNKILSNIYDYQDFSSIVFARPSLERLWDCFIDIFTVLGYSEGKVFSFALIKNCACLAIVGIAFLAIIYTLTQKENEFIDFTIIVFFISSIAVYSMMYSATNMGYVGRYNVPVVIFIFAVTAIGIKNIPFPTVEGLKQNDLIKNIICIISVVLVLFSCTKAYKDYFLEDNGKEITDVSMFLTEQGYKNGYASFWNANIITEISDGEIEVWDWRNSDQLSEFTSIDILHEWLQLKSHKVTNPSGKCFMIFSEYENNKFFINDLLSDENIIYKTEKYTVYGYEDYNEVHSAFK